MTNLHKPGAHWSGRAYINSWDLFRRKPPRAGRGRCAAALSVALVLCVLNAAGYVFLRTHTAYCICRSLAQVTSVLVYCK